MNERDDRDRPSIKDDPELSARLRNLDQQLEKRRVEERAEQERREKGPPKGAALAMRLAADFVAGVVLGAAIGWGVDRLFGISPWGLIVFLLLGFVAGILSVMRSAGLVSHGPAGPDDLGDRL